MIFRAFDELISSFPAVFWSQLSPRDAGRLLEKESKPGTFLEERVVGGVDGANVLLRRNRSFPHNPFAPIFAGDLRKTKAGSQLVGEFRRRKIVLLFCGLSYFILLLGIPFTLAVTPLMSYWFGASIFLGIIAGALSALTLVGALFAVAAVMRVGMHAAKQDASKIAAHIESAFLRGSSQ